jgi:hypothetical protein
MSFSVRAINVGEYVVVRHEGQLTRRQFENARLAAKRLLDENRWKRLLIDVRSAVTRVPIAEVYFVMKSLREVFPDTKIGLIFPPDRADEGKFAETVAVNRGVTLKSFTEYEKAVAWLTMSPA